MVTMKSIPIEALDALGLHEGDTLRVLGVQDDSFLVSISRDEPEPSSGRASEWLTSARGTVRLKEGESPDDARMGYYAGKYGLERQG